MNVDLPKKGKEPKVPQHIWLPLKTFLWVTEKARELNVAHNVFIAQLVEACRKAEEEGKFEPLKVIDKEVEVYRCPFCNFKTKVRFDLLQHLMDKHSDKVEIKKLE